MQNKEKIAIGFDLGTTSVGWAIIKYSDEDKRNCELIGRGVRIFPELQSQNKERRESRSIRRRIWRRNYRQYKLWNFLLEKNIVNSFEEFSNYICNSPNNRMPFEVKIKGLSQKLSNHELTYVLNSYIQKRGSFFDVEFGEKYKKLSEEREILNLEKSSLNKENKEDFKRINEIDKELKSIDKKIENEINKNVLEYNENVFPCENQQEWWKKYQKINSNFNYLFKSKEYKKELKQILNTQNKEDYFENLEKIFWNKREYWEGPGSEKSFSKYGRYDSHGNMIYEKLWEKNIGNCSWFIKEKRTFKNSPKYIIFNLLNRLAILSFEYKMKRYKLSKKMAKEFIEFIFESKKLSKEIKLRKIFEWIHEKNKYLEIFHDINFDEIKEPKKWLNELKVFGIELPKKEKNNQDIKISDFGIIINLLNFLVNVNIKLDSFNKDNLNILNLIYMSIATSIKFDDINEKINEILIKNNLINEKINNFCTNKKFWENESKKINPGKLSELALDTYLNYFFQILNENEPLLEQQSFYIENLIDTNNNEYEKLLNKKYYPKNNFQNEIIPSNVKRIFEQAINVFNAILKKYLYKLNYEIEFISIELARELNSKDEKQRILEINKNNESFLKKFKENYPNEYEKIKNFQLNSKNIKKLKLWCEQHGKDFYQLNHAKNDFSDISIDDLDNYQIDHIFPKSKTQDTRFSNLILTHFDNNQNKQEKTFYEFKKYDFEIYKKLWQQYLIEKVSRCEFITGKKDKLSKYEKLSFEGTSNNISSHFLTNALNDTRHVTSLFMNQIKIFSRLSYERKLKNTKIVSINGIITNSFKFGSFFEQLKDQNLLQKDRTKNEHHSIDALICAIIGKEKWALDIENNKYKNMEYDEESGEIKNNNINNLFVKKHYENLFTYKSLKQNECKFSTILRKQENNFSLFNKLPKSIKKINNEWFKIDRKNIYEINDFIKIKDFVLIDEKIKESIIGIIDEYNDLSEQKRKEYKTPFEYWIQNETVIDQVFKDKKIDVEYAKSFFYKKGLPIILNNNIQFVKKIQIRDKNKIKDLDKIFIIKKNIKPKKIKTQNQENEDNLSYLEDIKKSSIYENIEWDKIIIFKNNNSLEFLYITAHNLVWNNKTNKIGLNISTIIKFINEKSLNISNEILCKIHKNFDFNKIKKMICSECEKNILKSDSDKLVLSKGMCVYFDEGLKDIPEYELTLKKNEKFEIIKTKIDWKHVYYVVGGSQYKSNIEIKPIYGKEFTNAYNNKIKEIENNINNSLDKDARDKFVKQLNNLKLNPEFLRKTPSINQFVKNSISILDIDPLGNIKFNKSIFIS